MTKGTTFKPLTKPAAQPHGVLVAVDPEAQVLRLEIAFDADAMEEAPVSKSGKSRLLASTRGSLEIPGTSITLSINAMVPID